MGTCTSYRYEYDASGKPLRRMHTEPFMVGNCRWHMYGAWQEIPEDDPQLISWKNKKEERLARIKKKDRDCFLLTRTALLAGLCDYGVLWYCLDDQFPLVDELFVVLLIGAMFAFFWSLKRMVVEVFNAEAMPARETALGYLMLTVLGLIVGGWLAPILLVMYIWLLISRRRERD